MEPGTSRETLKRAGSPNPAGLREETPGEEAKGGDGRTAMRKQVGADCGNDGESNSQIKNGEEYEEELDPRIQVCC